jgi:predicted RNA-binding protein with PIN domain
MKQFDKMFHREMTLEEQAIIKLAYRMGSTNTIKVVTLDYLEQTTILNYGGIRVSPRELKEDINSIKRTSKKASTGKNGKINDIMSRIDPELLEKLEKFRRDKF